MFLDELSPLCREFLSQPVAFLGGFCSGLFRLNLADDPVKSWLDQQTSPYSSPVNSPNGSSNGPQSITID